MATSALLPVLLAEGTPAGAQESRPVNTRLSVGVRISDASRNPEVRAEDGEASERGGEPVGKVDVRDSSSTRVGAGITWYPRW